MVRALQARADFRVRALTRDASKDRGIADELVEADLNRRQTLTPAMEGAYGVFAVTNFLEPGVDEIARGTAAVMAARDAGVRHFVWSTVPNVEVISGGKYDIPQFTNKALVDGVVRAAGFRHYTFIVPTFFYQNLVNLLAPPTATGRLDRWALPTDPAARVVHAGDITELDGIVAEFTKIFGYFEEYSYLPGNWDGRISLRWPESVRRISQPGHGRTYP